MLQISRVRIDGSETDDIAPLGLFAAAADADFRCFWHSPEEERTLVGAGVAAEWIGSRGSELFQDAGAFVSELDFEGDTPLLFGGFAFRSASCSGRRYTNRSTSRSANRSASRSTTGVPDAFDAQAGAVPASEVSLSETSPESFSGCDSIWSGFPMGRLVLPKVLAIFPAGASEGHVEAVVCGAEAENLLDSLISNAAKLAERKSPPEHSYPPRLSYPPRHSPANPEPTAAATSADSETAYRRLLREAVEAVNSAELEKVVVATQVKHSIASAPEDVIHRLCERGRNSTVFAFSSVAADDASFGDTSSNNAPRGNPSGGKTLQSVFAGASPELLAAKSSDSFTSMALAGSKPLDEADVLLSDEKELAEHQFVVDHLRNRLEKSGAELAPTDPAEILRLANIAHLSSRVSGCTQDGILNLVETLHPSPAVAGVPTDAALEFLSQHEQFDRGWYAGPVGWLTPDGDGRFYVALRSVLLSPDECHLFAGSGIVEGSLPEKEEQETQLKLQTAMKALMP